MPWKMLFKLLITLAFFTVSLGSAEAIQNEAYIWQGQKLVQTRHIDRKHKPVNCRMYAYEPDSHVPVALWDQTLGLHHIDVDHSGTPKAMYRHDSGEEVWSTDHETYGKTRDTKTTLTHPVTGQPFEPNLRMAGQYEDIETGLYQNCYRFYDPHCGRYVSQDPIGLMGGLNAYQYCPNPVGYVDPLGLSSKECTDETGRPLSSPQYSVLFDTEVSPELYPGRSDRVHFQDANRLLYEMMQKDAQFAGMMEALAPGISQGIQPGARGAFPRRAPARELTWHHGTEPGNLQLVWRAQHKAPGPVQQTLYPDGVGGMDIWGGGRYK
ncbi:RHS repeat-associated core domain-containing protein [Saccharospirillum salsuginis]|uniref:RHS repeat-associated core domain-containing protein n=1 Tax=Saccharospirillum salsuginis TaxID=418750 RepID=A0A918NG53_9GAMM|nr:RHS repeat-associated core domain-containing protein [Saccharospirillum salsuginis]GGX64964.1 hypothetical protein GCM10007392_36030 [Saccharospirillum salsuginis]